MKFSQLFLIFAVAINWASSEHNNLIINKQLKAVKNNLDLDAQPCADFYQYACGKWAKNQPKPKFLNTFISMIYETNKELINIMENMSMKGKPSFVKKAYELFASCSTKDSSLHESPYMDWMEKNENVTWSLLSDSDDSPVDWVHLLGVTIKYNMNDVFINVNIRDEQKGGPIRVIFGVNKFVGSHSFLTKEFLETIKERLPLVTKDVDDLWSIIETFQRRLISLRLLVGDNPEGKLVSVNDLPGPWLKDIVSTVLPSPEGDIEIYIENEAYYEKLDELLQQYDDSFISIYLELKFLKLFYSVISGQNPNSCMLATRILMPLATNWIYEKQHSELLEEQVPQINQIFSSVLSSLNESLVADKSGLIPEAYLSKLNNVQLKVGILPRVDTDQILEKFYEKLEITESVFHENVINVLAFTFNVQRYYNVKELASNVDTFFDINLPKDLLNYWAEATDILIVPTMMLRQPLHHWGYDEAMMYGGLGIFIAKTLFADMVQVNSGLSLMEEEQILEVFLAAAINSAHKAYIKLYPDALTLTFDVDGLEITPNELFFFSAAQFQCSTDDAKSSVFNTALSYVPGFSKAFDCKTYEYLELFNRI